MDKRSKKNTKTRRLDPMIVVALIGLAGTIVAALLASPLLEKWIPPPSSVTETLTASPIETSALPAGTSTAGSQVVSKSIRLNETVTGTLYYDEPGIWIFNDGPATVTIILDVSPFGSALLILFDPTGVQRAYVDEQSPGIARLVNFSIPTAGDYKILVRNAQNSQVNYTLTVQDALTPPP
jgi:hypothetical protein